MDIPGTELLYCNLPSLSLSRIANLQNGMEKSNHYFLLIDREVECNVMLGCRTCDNTYDAEYREHMKAVDLLILQTRTKCRILAAPLRYKRC